MYNDFITEDDLQTPGPELVVEHRQLAVEDQRRGLELRECGRDVRVAAGVVDAVPAHQSDAGAVFVVP